MRNFPKQVNKIPKLQAAVKVAQEVISRDQNLHDDGVYGYSLVHAGVYTYHGVDLQDTQLLEARINTELAKPASSQGARTAARELRRFLLLLA